MPNLYAKDGSYNTKNSGYDYELIAPEQTTQVLGGTGAKGDILHSLLIMPTHLAALSLIGGVDIFDGATKIKIVNAFLYSASGEKPFFILLDLKSMNGPWKVTTGVDVSVLASGVFLK